MNTTRPWLHAALALVAVSLCLGAAAQGFPARPVTIVVPFPAGGIADSSVRAVAARMGERLGQAVVVDNRAGGSGQIAANAVRSAPADGHTLLLANVGSHAINSTLHPRLSYDPVKDFAPVTLLFRWTHVLVVPTDSPVKSATELARAARGAHMAYASQGIGSGGHLLAESYTRAGKFEATHIPYRGTAQVMPDLLTGRIHFFFDGVGIVPFVKEGKVRPLAVASPQRLPALPDVPTMAEAGFPGIELDAWFGIVAPTGTPAPVIARLHQELTRAALSPDIVSSLGDIGIKVGTNTPTEFAAFMASETVRLGKVVKASGARID